MRVWWEESTQWFWWKMCLDLEKSHFLANWFISKNCWNFLPTSYLKGKNKFDVNNKKRSSAVILITPCTPRHARGFVLGSVCTILRKNWYPQKWFLHVQWNKLGKILEEKWIFLCFGTLSKKIAIFELCWRNCFLRAQANIFCSKLFKKSENKLFLVCERNVFSYFCQNNIFRIQRIILEKNEKFSRSRELANERRKKLCILSLWVSFR